MCLDLGLQCRSTLSSIVLFKYGGADHPRIIYAIEHGYLNAQKATST